MSVPALHASAVEVENCLRKLLSWMQVLQRDDTQVSLSHPNCTFVPVASP